MILAGFSIALGDYVAAVQVCHMLPLLRNIEGVRFGDHQQ